MLFSRATHDTNIAIPGKEAVQSYTPEGSRIDIDIQFADVKHALGSVRRMNEAGNRVVLDEDVDNKATGERTTLTKERGSCVLTVWVPWKGNKGPQRIITKGMKPPPFSAAGNDDLKGTHPVRPGMSGITVEIAPVMGPDKDHQDKAYSKALEPCNRERYNGETSTPDEGGAMDKQGWNKRRKALKTNKERHCPSLTLRQGRNQINMR